MLRLATFDEAAGFLEAVRGCLEQQEVVTDLMIGLAERLVGEPLAYGSRPYFAAVSDAAGPVLAALMTPPHNLILHAAQEQREALELVARDLLARRWPVSGTLGTPALAREFAAVWTRLTGAAQRPGLSQRIYALRQVIHPSYSPGRLRPAFPGEAELVIAWMEAFAREALPGNPPPPPEVTRRRIADGHVFVWDDGGPVSTALKTRPTRRGITVAGVYTPPELRRRGYATSCVAALSARLLAAGCAYCTLFTDLSNPTSNAIYQQIGYLPVCDFQEIRFTAG